VQRCVSWDRGFESRWLHGYITLVSVVCCVVKSPCDELVTRSEESYLVCLCVTVCGLGTSTNSHPSPQFGCSTT